MNFRQRLAVSTLAIIGLTCFFDTARAAPMVTDTNLLSGLAANPANVGVSSYFNDGSAANAYGPGAADYGPQNSTNGAGGGAGAGNDFVFAQGDSDERLAITGFNSRVSDIRVWTASDLAPSQITIYSSTTSETSINSANYSSLLSTVVGPAWIAGTGASMGLEYADFQVSAPAGTQSLLFDFGATNSGNPQIPGFVRVAEVQAFAPVPEPSTIVALCGLAAMGLFLFARRGNG
jgi:hypothetical protein